MFASSSSSSSPVPWHRRMFAGSLAGVLARSVGAPFDVVKIRMQVQLEPLGAANAKYKGTFHTIKTLVAEEGVLALWKGNLSAELLWGAFFAAQFTTYGTIKKLFKEEPNAESALVAGSVAAGVATLVTYPLDLLRTVFASQGEPRTFFSLSQATKHIVRKNGILGLWQGATPALISVVPQGGIGFAVYEVAQKAMKKHLPTTNAEIGNFSCGFTAGCIAKLLTLPMDVAKKRIQVQSFERPKDFGRREQYLNALDCLKKAWNMEGAQGWFRGAVPSLLKTGITSGVAFAVFERVLKAIS